MKPIKKLKLSDVAPSKLDASEMGELYAGIDGGIMLMSYGCKQNVCSNNSEEGQKTCTTDTCELYTCVTSNR